MLLWLALLAIALPLDRGVAEWIHRAEPLSGVSNAARHVMRLPGIFWFTLGVCVLLGVLHRAHGAAVVALLATSAMVGVVYSVVKWIVGRHRPVLGIAPFSFHPFAGGMVGLFHAERGLSFPSGDATLAFATAACLQVLAPRASVVLYLWAIVVAAERVLENAHYVSDVIAAAGIGIIIGHLVTRQLMSTFAFRMMSKRELPKLRNQHVRP